MVTQVKLNYINRLLDSCLSDDDTSLEVKAKFIGDEGLEALMLCKRLESVENMDLTKNNLTHRSMPYLANCAYLQSLKRL